VAALEAGEAEQPDQAQPIKGVRGAVALGHASLRFCPDSACFGCLLGDGWAGGSGGNESGEQELASHSSSLARMVVITAQLPNGLASLAFRTRCGGVHKQTPGPL
jgi:hypothetical protein